MRHRVAEGIAIVNVYLKHPVGIGEHPQHLDEIDKLLQKLKMQKRRFLY